MVSDSWMRSAQSRIRDTLTVAQLLISQGYSGTADATRLALRQRKVVDPPSFPEAPLGWESSMQKISQHYALHLATPRRWTERETRLDVRRISSISLSASKWEVDIPQVAIVEATELRRVLATIEALRSWPECRNLRVLVCAGPDRDDEPWQILSSIPGVELSDTRMPDRTQPTLQAGKLPMPHWSPYRRNPGKQRRSGSGLAKRLLLLTPLMPDPRRGSGAQDVYWFARHAVDLGYETLLVPMKPNLGDTTARWAFRRSGVAVASGNYSAAQVEQALPKAVHNSDLVAAFSPLLATQARNLLRQSQSPAPLLFVPLDLQQFPQRVVLERGLSSRFAQFGFDVYDEEDYEGALRMESAAMEASDLTALISTAELDALRTSEYSDRLHHLPMLRSQPQWVAQRSEHPRVVFVGGFGHPPNYLSLEWFLSDVWPIVRSEAPQMQIDVFGADLHPDWAGKWSSLPGVQVLGPYEDETTPYVGDVVAVAPLIYGGGVKGKVVSAIGHGAVVVGTEFATQGLPDMMQQVILKADSPGDFADRLVQVCADGAEREYRRNLGQQAYQQYFSEAAGREYVKQCLDALQHRAARSGFNN